MITINIYRIIGRQKGGSIEPPRTPPAYAPDSMRMRLHMLKHCVGKGSHVMKQATYMPQSVAILRYSGYRARAGYMCSTELALVYIWKWSAFVRVSYIRELCPCAIIYKLRVEYFRGSTHSSAAAARAEVLGSRAS